MIFSYHGIVQFDTRVNLFCLVLLKLDFSSSMYLTTDTIQFDGFYIVYCVAFSGIFVSSCISLYYLDRLFTKSNLSWLIFGLIKDIETKTSIVFSLGFANNTILQSFFLFLLITYCWLLLIADHWLLFNCCSDSTNINPIPKLAISTETPINEGNAEIKTHPPIPETKTRKCSK